MNQDRAAQFRHLGWTALFALIGWGIGWLVGAVPIAVAVAGVKSNRFDFLAERIPLPHHVPEHRDGASLRFAMVQDVLHERFARHAPAFYAARNRLVESRLQSLGPDDPARFSLIDDLAVGQERLGQSHAAADLIRAKLADQRRLGWKGRELYTSDANLGTFLIHENLPSARVGDQTARTQFAAGVDFIRQAVAENPAAHFGRERWQVVIAEFLQAAMADPQVLRRFDFLGNSLSLDIETILNREAHWVENGGYGRPTTPRFSRLVIPEVPEYFQPGVRPGDPAFWERLKPIRAEITKVGAEEGWLGVDVPALRAPVPFDEPTLGIIGMWRQGGGANPHFALALGETMLRVGQRRLAWSAFERAERLADRFWPDPSLVEFCRSHCRSRQAAIEATLADRSPRQGSSQLVPWQQVSPPRPDDSPAQLHARFDAELAFGESYQRRFQAYEQDRIEAGASVDDPRFDDAFPPGPIPVASPVGAEEFFIGIPHARIRAYGAEFSRACGLAGAGICALLAALILRFGSKPFVPQVRAVAPGPGS